jgi:hypothetical protein
MKNRKDSVVLLCFAYHRNQNINNKETRQETKEAVVFFGLFTVKKRKTVLDFRKQKENHRIGGRDFCYCFTGSPSLTPPIATNRSRNPSRKRGLLCLSFPVLSSLFCVRAAARRQKRQTQRQKRERWRAGHLLGIFWLFSIVYAKNEKIGFFYIRHVLFFVTGTSCNVETRDSTKKICPSINCSRKRMYPSFTSVSYLSPRKKGFFPVSHLFLFSSSVLSIDFFRFFACANLKNFTWKLLLLV